MRAAPICPRLHPEMSRPELARTGYDSYPRSKGPKTIIPKITFFESAVYLAQSSQRRGCGWPGPGIRRA